MSVIINTAGLDRMTCGSEVSRRQTEYAMRCAFVMRQYVPVDETTLRSSEPVNSVYDKGILVWSTPYALKQYSVPMSHTESGTTDHWDEVCARNDMPALMRYAESLYGGY